MKKNVIAVILSIVMAVGSIGTAVPVFAAEEGSTTEAGLEVDKTETSVEDVEEEKPEVATEPDDVNEEQNYDDEDTTQSDVSQNSDNENSTTETTHDSEELPESDEEQPDDEEDLSDIDEADSAYVDSWDNYDYEPEKVEFNGNYYYFRNCGMRNSYGFDQAEAWCEQEGGHLVTINSPEEEAFIRSEIKKIDVLYGFWIGAYRNNTSESWKWINGEKWNYPGTNGSGTSNWPSNAIRIAYFENGKVIGDSTLDNTNGFICEWEDEKDISKASVTLKDAFQDDEGNNCYEYTGAQIKPGILEVRLGDKTLVNGTDYTAAYGTNLSYGEATVTVKGKGDYKGELVVKFMIVPKKITGLKGNNKLSTNTVAYTNYRRGLDLTWDKNPDKTIAYEIQYSKKSDFSDAKMAAVKAGTNTFSPKEEPLERGAEYYVRVRAYKEVNQKYYNGKWSDSIKVKAGNQILTSELWGFKNYNEKLTLTDFITVFGNEKGEAGAHYRDEYKGQYGTDPLKVKGEDASNTFMSPFRILFNNGIWTDGICGGMCNTAIVYYNYNTPDFGTYPELSSITAADLPNIKSKAFNNLTLKDSIKYAQIAQRDSRRWYFEDLLSKNRLDMLYQAVIECEMAETEPVNIGIVDGEVAHQVIAVGIKEETPTYVVIEVYDPNRVTVPSELKLYKNSIGEFYAWEFPFKDQVIMYSDISSDDDGCIYLDRTTPFVATAFSQIDQQGFASNLTFRPYLSASGSENTDLEFLQDHLNKAGINWAQELQDAETSASETTNNGTLKTVSYLVDTDTINISNVPAGVELTFAEGNQFVSVEPTTESNIYIKLYDNDNSSIKVIPQKDGTCKVTFFRGEPMPSTYTDLKRVEADVNGNQEFVINNEIDNIYFSGAKNIAINRDSGNISKDNSITNETIASLETELNLQDKYRFFQEDDIAYIKCDKDNNGEYETGITESEVETSGPKIIASGTCGENVSWKLDEDGVLTISGSGKMKDYYSNPFSLYKYEVKKVRIETGVTSIGSNAFDGCSNLTSITIPEGVTKIGSFAFGRCSSLRNLTIPESVTIINGYAFDECNSLTSITIPKSVKIIDGCAFEACSNLASVKIPEGVTSIEWRAFYNCSSLKSITIPKGVQRIDSQAFANCSNLKSVTILDPETWINDEVFLDCINLSTVTLPDVIPIIQHRAFHNTMWLKAKGDFPSVNGILLEYQGKEDNVVIPDEVTTIGIGAFYEQESIVSITIPDSVTSINDLAFYKCRGLKNIIIPDSVTSIGHLAFEDCISLKQITLPRNIKSMSVSIFDNDKELTVTVKNKYGLKYCQDNGIPYIDRSAIETKLTSFNGSDIRINITKREDASGYQIKYADNSSMTNAKSVILKGSNNLSKVITGLKNDKTYYVKIQSYQTIKGNTYWSNWSAAKSIKVTQTPYPTNVSKLSTYIGSHIKVDWTKTAGASGYHIKYADNSSMTGAIEVMVKGNSTFTKTLTGLKNGKTYYVKIQTYRTVSGKTYWSSWSPAKSIKVDQKPYGSSISKLTNPSSKAMKITWDKVSSASGYHIQYATNSNMTGPKDIMVNNKDTLSKTVTGLTKGKTYYVRIQTFRKVSGKTYWSSWSKAKQIKISK